MGLLEQAKEHVLFHHHSADGFITVAKKEPDGAFRQYHYKPEELAAKLTEWLGEDVYFSQNTFYKPSRKIENIRQIRALYVDVDFYLFNYNKEWVLGNIELLVEDNEIPQPNLIIHSGQGVVCVWFIEPVPHMALPLWNVLQNDFLQKLKELGGDSKATDVTRIFRVAGSINSKNGEVVHVEYLHKNRYVLKELQSEFLPELEQPKEKKKGKPSKVVHVHKVRQLHHARLLDVVKLVELRNYDVRGHRELILFLYRYWLCCFLNDGDEALDHTLALNRDFLEPLPKREVIRATKSAEKAWAAKNDARANEEAIKRGYPGAGYNIKNKKIIEWLDITPEEQRHLKTIIDANEKRRRKRTRDKLTKREERGSVSRAAYLENEKRNTEKQLNFIRKQLVKNPKIKQKELAGLLGVSDRHIRRLVKQL
jgi:hypothetical protein